MSKGLIAVVAGVLMVALVIAGCGSSDSDSGDNGSNSSGGGDETVALTKVEFIKQADSVCEKGNKAIEDGADKFAKDNNVDTEKPTEEQKEEVIVEVVAPEIRQQGEEIGELGAPEGDEAKVEAIVTSLEDAADELESEPKSLFEGKSPLADASKLGQDYGFKVCGAE
jgi:hypothetical protein